MHSNPIESAPGNQFIILQDEREGADVYEIARWSVERGDWIREDGELIQIIPSHWLPLDHLSRLQRGVPRGWRRFGLRAALLATAGLAMMFVPLVLNNWAGPWEKERLFIAGSTPSATEGSSQDDPNSPDSAIKHQQAAEQERQRGEVLARQLASAREDVGTLTARVTALTDARTEPENALQAAQASAAEQKLALEQERARGARSSQSGGKCCGRFRENCPGFGRRAEASAGTRARARRCPRP